MVSPYASVKKVKTEWPKGAQSRTKQSFAKETNINNIVKKFSKTGVLPAVVGTAMYGDFSDVADYQTQCNRVNSVAAFFKSLPAEVRAKFNHSPVNMLEFVNDPANVQEAVELGLLPKEMLPANPPTPHFSNLNLTADPAKDPASPPAK